MSDRDELAGLGGFVARVLSREGALAEARADGVIEAVLPADLQSALALPESPLLRVVGNAGEGELPFPLEGQGLQWCLERALSRGRCANVRLPDRRVRSTGVAEAALRRVSVSNGTTRAVGVRIAEFCPTVLEVHYDAVSEERVEGSVFLAIEPRFGVRSFALARALLEMLAEAEPDRGADESSAAAGLVDLAAAVSSVVADELAGFRRRLAERASRDAERIADYHATLLREASKRRRSAGDGATALAAKSAAIERQRDEKLAELARRFAIDCRLRVGSLLGFRYDVAVADLVLVRRKRELPLAVPFDSVLRDFLPRACAYCGASTFSFHVCDEAGHASCTTCAAPCPGCSTVTCRGCFGSGCRRCARATPPSPATDASAAPSTPPRT